ncbi:MAG: metallophosphoesterase [Nanoarchaeota archaeon]
MSFPEENKKDIEFLKEKLGLNEGNFENFQENEKFEKQEKKNNIKILSSEVTFSKNPEVKDFVKNLRNRFDSIRKIIMEHSELEGLVSINKISSNRKRFSVIGMVSDKRITREKNLLLEIEDLTGKMRVLINKNKPELFEKAENITLDSVLGFKGTGKREILFASDVIFPDSMLFERKKSPFDENVLFLGDLHFGSKLFLKNNFLKFIDYVNCKIPNTPEAEKVKYIFLVGDIITGVGNYPNQEEDLEIYDLEEQFLQLSEILKKIRKDITIIISPGNHDCVRIMEPQPVLDEKFAWALYDMENVIITTNPALVNIGAKGNFEGFNVLTYHGFSFTYYAGNIPKLLQKRAMNCPEEIMKYLLINRHLAPTHASVQFFPLEDDALIIKKVPDIFVAAHTHKSGVSSYNNTLIISTSCWEEMTPYQEKFGNKPDHCKVPMLNLKKGVVKILDFEEVENENRN